MAIRVRVRIAHSNVNLIVVMLQRKLKAQGVKVCRLFLVYAYDLACGLGELSCHSITISIQLLAVNFTKGLIILIVCNIIT